MKRKILKIVFGSLAGFFALGGAANLVRHLLSGPPLAEKPGPVYAEMVWSVGLMIVCGLVCHRLFVSAFAKPGKERLH